MQEKPENNERMRNDGTSRAGSKQMKVVNGKQKLFGVA